MRKIKNILNKLFLLIVCILLVFVLLLTNTNKKVLAYTMNENLDLFKFYLSNRFLNIITLLQKPSSIHFRCEIEKQFYIDGKGTVTVSKGDSNTFESDLVAKAGDKITIKTEGNKYMYIFQYKVDKITLKDENGKPIEGLLQANNTFIMPDYSVIVNVTFKE